MSRQDAILRLPQLRNAGRQPNSRSGQDGGKNEGCQIRQHPMSEFVVVGGSALSGTSPGPTGIRFRMRRAAARWRRRKGARGEFDHACTVLGLGWHLNFHSVPVRR